MMELKISFLALLTISVASAGFVHKYEAGATYENVASNGTSSGIQVAGGSGSQTFGSGFTQTGTLGAQPQGNSQGSCGPNGCTISTEVQDSGHQNNPQIIMVGDTGSGSVQPQIPINSGSNQAYPQPQGNPQGPCGCPSMNQSTGQHANLAHTINQVFNGRKKRSPGFTQHFEAGATFENVGSNGASSGVQVAGGGDGSQTFGSGFIQSGTSPSPGQQGNGNTGTWVCIQDQQCQCQCNSVSVINQSFGTNNGGVPSTTIIQTNPDGSYTQMFGTGFVQTFAGPSSSTPVQDPFGPGSEFHQAMGPGGTFDRAMQQVQRLNQAHSNPSFVQSIAYNGHTINQVNNGRKKRSPGFVQIYEDGSSYENVGSNGASSGRQVVGGSRRPFATRSFNQPQRNSNQGSGYNQPRRNSNQGSGYNQPRRNSNKGSRYNRPSGNSNKGSGFTQYYEDGAIYENIGHNGDSHGVQVAGQGRQRYQNNIAHPRKQNNGQNSYGSGRNTNSDGSYTQMFGTGFQQIFPGSGRNTNPRQGIRKPLSSRNQDHVNRATTINQVYNGRRK